MPLQTDVVVVGSGPNGFSAAILAAGAGLRTCVFEQSDLHGGGVRSASLTLPGFTHDICSAIHPMGAASPVFRSFGLGRFGLEWVEPESPMAHPFDDGRAAVLERSVSATARTLGEDGPAYERWIGSLAADWDCLVQDILAPFRIPRHPVTLARFGMRALLPAVVLARLWFSGPRARGFFSGLCAHSSISLDWAASSATGLVLAIAGHSVGWPFPRGGAQRLSDALRSCLESRGGILTAGKLVESLDELTSPLVLLDLTPRQVIRIAGKRLEPGYRRRLGSYRYGPGVFKVDWALDGPIPWRARECFRAGTVHLGGSMEEIVHAENQVASGREPDKPFVLVAQHCLFDPSRAPPGKQTGWAYCHVPNGSEADMTDRIESQVERFAPGFRNRILSRHTFSPSQLEAHNPNCIGGDISGGMNDLFQILFRPVPRLAPYSTGTKGLYICSSSTPPGAGVHGLCGFHAARAALNRL